MFLFCFHWVIMWEKWLRVGVQTMSWWRHWYIYLWLLVGYIARFVIGGVSTTHATTRASTASATVHQIEHTMRTQYQQHGWTYLRDINQQIEQMKRTTISTPEAREIIIHMEAIYRELYNDFTQAWGSFGQTTVGVVSDEVMQRAWLTHAPTQHVWAHTVAEPVLLRPRTVRTRATQPQRLVVSENAFNATPTHTRPATRSTSTSTYTAPTYTSPSSSTTVSRTASLPLDMRTLQRAWVDRVNEVRERHSLPSYQYNLRLERTAQDWTQTMMQKRTADHRRTPQSTYYNYTELEAWFAERWLVFELIGRSTFTENVGWAHLNCTGTSDCTQQALRALRNIFDYFAAEEFSTTYRAHWETMIHPTFRLVGVWIAYDEAHNRLYMTSHHSHYILP